MQKYLQNRFRFITLTFLLFLTVSAIMRTILLIKSVDMVDLTFFQVVKIYAIGGFYDFVAASYLAIPFIVYLLLLPKNLWMHKIHKYITYLFIYVVLFGLVFYSFSEWFFWDEFGVRFNFIAVDYLVYTTEVIGNIRESYPMGILLSVIAILAGMLFYMLLKYRVISYMLKDDRRLKQRLLPALFYLALPIVFFNGVTQAYAKISTDQYNNELAKSGLYSLFAAFRNNTLDYETFYLTEDEKSVFSHLRTQLDPNAKNFLGTDITHKIIKTGEEKDYNVMLVVVESLSGEFLESLNGRKGLAPNLDKLAKESLFFNNFYATGTRTVRGMESITLSIPPTAGRSIVKRPDNHAMFSSGFIFKNKGYETKFIYGGHGYFDNMNEFFSHNGFDVVDRTDFSDEEDTFHTIWGVCDENLFDKAIKEADASYKAHKPFMSFIMTTSNHRPYDYPEGRIDIPSHTGRDGAVKYTDYAIGKFINDAKDKPWFKNTIFVVVADHCASSAGKTDLPLNKYHIPLFVYAPDIITPKAVNKLSSQVDLMPTLFSILNWSYDSKFYGQDILSPSFEERALVGTYQKLGLYKDNVLSILSPGKKIQDYEVTKLTIFDTQYKEVPAQQSRIDDTVAYYQGASTLHKKHLDRYDDKI
jgi:phosphoglycerol transferase MdoB-like AlkP superfamily enzyme